MAHMYNDGRDETGKAKIGQPNIRSAQPTMTDMSKVAGIEAKAAMAHDAGDRQLEKSYLAQADILRKAADPAPPLLTGDSGISVLQQLVDLAATYTAQATKARLNSSSRAEALTATASNLTARAGRITAGK